MLKHNARNAEKQGRRHSPEENRTADPQMQIKEAGGRGTANQEQEKPAQQSR
jgi:hypothetical protein